MNIQIVDLNDESITSFECDCMPYKIGEIIHLRIENGDKSVWDIKNLSKDYKIIKIEHFVRLMYNKKYNLSATTYITVMEN